ncbi:YraN family protein [Fundidesulfovibrio agrisoli]|uniref:YraN family protein n=1 Tax=Fundidesulfovibrio agrisoli TaxID=2922717 RepID=UPI001FAE62B3
MPAGHLTLGREGEDAAESLLRRAGMRVLERNFRCRTGELDLVCQHGDTIVFVEVKTRGLGSLGSGTDAVDGRKRGKLIRAASEFLSARGWWERPCRFDVVSVVSDGERLTAEHVPDAFQADFAADGKGRGRGGGWQPW